MNLGARLFLATLITLCSLKSLQAVAADQSSPTTCSDSQSKSSEYGTYQLFNDYAGVVAGKAVGMTLTFHGSRVDGQVFVAPDFRDMPVKGQVNSNGDVTLSIAASNTAIASVFHGKFKDLVYCDSLDGSWDQPVAGIPATGWVLDLGHTGSADEGKNYYSRLGVSDDHQIDDNAQALQQAIRARDKQTVAKMVDYPLPVMFGRKPVKIKNSEQFLEYYDQIFLPYLVSEIAAAIPHHMFSKGDGALLTSTIWLDNTGKLSSIDVIGEPIACAMSRNNTQSASSGATTDAGKKLDLECKEFAGSMPAEDPKAYETNYVCDTPKHHIVVDSKADEVPRYRAWVKPHPMTAKPDMEIDLGAEEVEGTGECAYSTWTFKKGDTQFDVGQLGCTDGSEPKGAVGQLNITIHGELKQTLWCMSNSEDNK